MKIFKLFTLVVVASLFSVNANADVALPAKCEAFQPQVFLKHTITENEAKKVETSSSHGQDVRPSSPKHWVVFSDRCDNVTYNGPSTSSGTCTKLDFNEKVRIAKISGDFALVYKEPQDGIDYPKISSGAKSKGWIQLSHLLLWRTCPTDEHGIYYKALIVTNVDKEVNSDLGNRYFNPSKSGKIEKLTSDMKFYFIMKRASNGLVLLSNEYKMDGATDDVLFGWVSESSFVPWNQRSCLEPNWEPEVVEYFKSQGKDVNIYTDKSLNQRCAHLPYGIKNPDDNNTETCYRMNKNALRFPILNNDTNNDQIYKCTTFGGGDNLAEAQALQARLTAAKEKLSANIQQINLIIVIDGTTSMEKYFPAVKHAILEGLNYFRDNFKVRAGLVIYRDYEDGPGLVEYVPLTEINDARLRSMLDSGGKYGVKSSPKDHTHTEALYKGLEIALDMDKMGYKADHSNLILVVGDCGNALDDSRSMSEAQILQKLVKNDIQLMAFQVRRHNSQPWLLFTDQMNRLIKNNLEQKYKNYPIKLKFTQLVDGYDFTPGTKKEYYIGSTRYANIGEDMEPGKLSSLIRGSVGHFADAIDDQLSTIFNPNVAAASSLEARVEEAFLKSKLKERYNDIKKSNTMVSFTGYTKKKDDSDREYWKPIIYISNDELNTLINQLQGVNAAAQTGDRKPYVDAMKALVRTMESTRSVAEMDQMGVQEIMNMITGLNESSQALKGPSLIQVADPKAVSNAKFQEMVTRFLQKYNGLLRLKNNKNYKYSLMINNTKYYWIPIEDLP